MEYDIGIQRQVDVDGENFGDDDDDNRPLDADESHSDEENSNEDDGRKIIQQQPTVFF